MPLIITSYKRRSKYWKYWKAVSKLNFKVVWYTCIQRKAQFGTLAQVNADKNSKTTQTFNKLLFSLWKKDGTLYPNVHVNRISEFRDNTVITCGSTSTASSMLFVQKIDIVRVPAQRAQTYSYWLVQNINIHMHK